MGINREAFYEEIRENQDEISEDLGQETKLWVDEGRFEDEKSIFVVGGPIRSSPAYEGKLNEVVSNYVDGNYRIRFKGKNQTDEMTRLKFKLVEDNNYW